MSAPVTVASGRVAYRMRADDARLGATLALVHHSFAYMDGRIDPPSSVHRLDIVALRTLCDVGEVWCIGDRPDAVVVLTPRSDALYLGKLAVADSHRGRGFARDLVELAGARAATRGFAFLELEVRIELVENQTAFKRLGFEVVRETAHAGFDRPTSVTMRAAVPPSPTPRNG